MSGAPVPAKELLVTRGGPFHGLLHWAGYDTPAPAITLRAAILLGALAWVPLFTISLAEARHIGTVAVPLLRDFSSALRFLVALPLLVLAEAYVEPRLAAVPGHFVTGGVLPSDEQPRLAAAVEQALRLRDARIAYVALPLLALAPSLLGFTSTVPGGLSSWHSVLGATGPQQTWAGTVYDYVSLPLYRFVILTWFWRYLVWIRFLWETSRLRLHILPIHPDLSGGLAFIGVGQSAFGVLIAGLSISAAGVVAMQAVYTGKSLPSFYPLLGGYLAFILVVFFGPLLVFTPALFRAKRRGLHQYSALGEAYATVFTRKWIEAGPRPGEPLLGSPDIQSLADLANSFDVVRRMRAYPFDRRTMLVVLAAAVVPLLAVALVEYPLSRLLGQLVRLLL
jgi:hypothetical protein